MSLKKRLVVFSLITALTLVFGTNEVQAADSVSVVQTDSTYSYTQMCKDIVTLNTLYPDCVTYDVAGYTVQGKVIPYVILGNPEAPKKVLVTSTIHAREYLNSQVVMKYIEDYACAYQAGIMTDVLDSTVFYIIPMCNPDGVDGVQTGALSGGWKANVNGVDLNRNFSAGWEQQTGAASSPGKALFKGYTPESEPEVQAILNVGTKANWNFVLNFHQKGNVIYSGTTLASNEYNDLCYQYATIIRKVNGYKAAAPCYFNGNSSKCYSYGTYGDYIGVVYKVPYVTIETGSALPPSGQSQFNNIYSANLKVFETLSKVL